MRLSQPRPKCDIYLRILKKVKTRDYKRGRYYYMAPPTGVDLRMGPVWLLLLLLTPLHSAQVSIVSELGTTAESEDPTASVVSTTGEPGTLYSPDPSGSVTISLEAPKEDWTPAEVFLYSGDYSVLGMVECDRAYSLTGQNGPLPRGFYGPLRPSMDALANTANFLNMIFQASDLRESSVREDMEWYHAMVRALLEADPLIRQALLTFDADPASTTPQLVLRASRNPAPPRYQNILLQDLSSQWESLHLPAPAPDDTWFSSFKFPASSNQPTSALSKRVLLNDLSTLDTPKWGRGDSYVTNRSGVRWANGPFLECEVGRFLPGWLLTLSTSFYGLKPDLSPEFRGVIRVDVNVQGLDVNQCDMGDAWFANTHQCNRTTMECEPITGQGFRLGQYCCRCREGYYSPPMDGGALNSSGGEGGGVCYPALPICLPCWPGCRRCEDGSPCWVEEDRFLRAGVLAVQGFFMLLVFISMLVAYQFRRSRRIRASGLLLLETILFGSLLLYFPVFILYFKPSTFRCILLRWVRLLGFAIVYGTVTLKIYRVLKVFLSRTAQRVPYMSSIHLLRLLGVMVVTVSWFLCAWTAGVLQNRDRNVPLLIITTTSDGQGFSLCDLDRWDYMMAVAELMFLCWGSLLCSAVKPVPSAFHEPRYIGIAIHNELLLSSMFHLLRFVMPSLHPDWMLLLFFTHTHVTITVTLALLFIPKFLHVSRAGREEIAEEVYEDEVDLRRSGSYLNSSFTSAVWSDHSMDPDDIRDELKKLYGQLEVHKTKKMTANNPHLQKKRSSRRGLGRSIIKRITEIPESMSRQCSRDGKEVNLGSRDVTHSESCKRAPDTFSINYKDEPVKQPSPVLRKSQSDYDYVTDKDPSLHDSMLRANLAKRCSQRSETDSLDIAPLVCKSASAQNLTVDNNLLLPGPTKLHKSLSLASSKAHSLEDTYRGGRNTPGEQRQSQQDIAIKDQTSSALVQSQSYDKAEVCPWELAEERPANKNQPHVTFAPSEEEPQSPESISSPILKHICPWDHLPVPNPAESPAGDSQGGEADCESPRPQTPISTSVPGSPKAANDMRVFSFRTSTQKWLSVKSFVGSVDASIKEKAKKETAGDTVKKQDSISRKSQGSVAAIAVIAALKLKTPGTEAKSRSVSILEKKCGVSSVDKRTQQKRSMTTGDVKPVLVKQAAIRLSSSDSSERSPRRIVVVQSTVYPWDSEDMQKDSVYENVFISRENTAHSTAKTPSTHRRGSQIRPALSVSQSEICPWDVPASSQQAPQRQQSTTADICPWEVEEPEEDPKAPARVSVCPWESEGVFKRQESVRGDVCPWEADVSAIPITSASKQSEKKPEGLNKKARDVCPWETDETPQISHGLKPQKSVRVDVCPWDVGDSFPDKVKVPIIYENVNPQEDKGLRNAPPKCQETIHANVCPWESEETPKSQDGERENVCHWEPTDTASMGKQDVQTKSTEKAKSASEKLSVPLAKACPWEFPDPQKDLTVLCPWEEESTMPPITIKITKRSFSQETKTDICPWDIGDQEKTDGKDGPCTNVCPWETQGRTQADPKKTDSIRVNICPWETEKPEKTEQQDSSPAIVSIETGKTKRQDSLLADVCPWETGANDEPDKTKRRDGTQTDVGPWETEEPKKTEEKDGVKVDVCPWEPGETDKTNGQDSTEADISKETQKEKRRDSVQVNICPWETDVPEEPEKMKKQDSVGADVCVCETGPAEESENTQIQDSTKADICPWETRHPIEPEKIKKQESVREDVCSWETDEPEKSAEKEETILASGRQYVTETQGALSMEQGDAAEPAAGSPQGAEAAKANVPLARRDAMCPWEMEETKPPSSPSSITEHDNNSDIFTWDPENIPEEEEEEDDAESAAEAFVFPSDL